MENVSLKVKGKIILECQEFFDIIEYIRWIFYCCLFACEKGLIINGIAHIIFTFNWNKRNKNNWYF